MVNLAKLIVTFGKLTEMEALLLTAIKKSHIPTVEVRNFLKSESPLQMEATPLFQYLKTFFYEIGIGTLKVHSVGPFEIVFHIDDSQISSLFENIKPGKTCYITVDALKMFFEMDMGIPCDVSETACKNDGSDYCEFYIKMQPVSVYKKALDESDVEIIKALLNNTELDMSPEEYSFREDCLKKYRLLDSDGKVTDIGRTFYNYIKNVSFDDFEAPWKHLSEISEVIASARSFAEAFSLAMQENVEKVNSDDVINLVSEAKTSKSFADLVSKEFKEVDMDEW